MTATTTFVCDVCESDDVACDADVVWNPMTKSWEIDAVHSDNLRCRNCGNDTDFSERQIEVPVADGPLPASVTCKLQQLLATRTESDGGWAPVGPHDLNLLDQVIRAIVAAKYGPDPDGDRPIEWDLVNRHTHVRLPFEPVPYPTYVAASERKSGVLAEMARNNPTRYMGLRLSAARYNFAVAAKEMSHVTDEIDRNHLRADDLDDDGWPSGLDTTQKKRVCEVVRDALKEATGPLTTWMLRKAVAVSTDLFNDSTRRDATWQDVCVTRALKEVEEAYQVWAFAHPRQPNKGRSKPATNPTKE